MKKDSQEQSLKEIAVLALAGAFLYVGYQYFANKKA